MNLPPPADAIIRANRNCGRRSMLHEAGRLDEAEGLYRAIVASPPAPFAALHGLGVLLHIKGRSSEAIASLTAAVRVSPTDAGAWSDLGVCLRSGRALRRSCRSLRSGFGARPPPAPCAQQSRQRAGGVRPHRRRAREDTTARWRSSPTSPKRTPIAHALCARSAAPTTRWWIAVAPLRSGLGLSKPWTIVRRRPDRSRPLRRRADVARSRDRRRARFGRPPRRSRLRIDRVKALG